MPVLEEDEPEATCSWCGEDVGDDGIYCEESEFGLLPGAYCSVECMIGAA